MTKPEFFVMAAGFVTLVLVFLGIEEKFKSLNNAINKPVTIAPRRGEAQDWAHFNPVLRNEELGLELGTRKIKIGDGKTKWNDLPYEADLMPAKLVPTLKVYRGA